MEPVSGIAALATFLSWLSDQVQSAELTEFDRSWAAFWSFYRPEDLAQVDLVFLDQQLEAGALAPGLFRDRSGAYQDRRRLLRYADRVVLDTHDPFEVERWLDGKKEALSPGPVFTDHLKLAGRRHLALDPPLQVLLPFETGGIWQFQKKWRPLSPGSPRGARCVAHWKAHPVRGEAGLTPDESFNLKRRGHEPFWVHPFVVEAPNIDLDPRIPYIDIARWPPGPGLH